MNRRTRLAALAVGAALGLGTGCGPRSAGPTGTNERADERPQGGQAGPAGDSFRLLHPDRVELARGGAKPFEVAIDRGAAFRSEVKFSLWPPTRREARTITFAPADWMFSATDTRRTVTARAAADATPGTYTWTLIVRPRVGAEVTRTLTVVVNP
jgi:hypothetical protein